MAYKLSGLVKKLKEKGLDVAEEVAKEVYMAVDEWALEEAAKAEHGLVDGVVTVAVPQIRPLVLGQIDKIGGKEG